MKQLRNVHVRKDENGKVVARLMGIPGRSPKQKKREEEQVNRQGEERYVEWK